MLPGGGTEEKPAGLRSNRESGSTLGGGPGAGCDEDEAEGPRDRDESAAKSSIIGSDAEAAGAAAGATSSKSKSIRLTCCAAVLAFAVESLVVNLHRKSSQCPGTRDLPARGDARGVNVGRGVAVAGLEGLVAPYDVVNQVVHEQEAIYRTQRISSSQPDVPVYDGRTH